MWAGWKCLAACSLVGVGMGCATRSGTGLTVGGNQDAQTATVQVDALEVKEKGFLNTVASPFVWIKENPGKSLTATALSVAAFFAYDEWVADDGRSGEPKTEPIQGVTQAGDGNIATFKDVESCPNVFQAGKDNVFECDRAIPEM